MATTTERAVKRHHGGQIGLFVLLSVIAAASALAVIQTLGL
ncbi:hypothetical protein [Henriciella algicola]|jgi:hypothetical protein|nr:hypothetical protein [Henriciella algicola]